MDIYHGIFVCDRDTPLLETHIQNVHRFSQSEGVSLVGQYAYYGITRFPKYHLGNGYSYVVVGVDDYYENLPMKTYLMLKHALEWGAWDRFLKTDVNSKVLSIDWGVVAKHDLVGYLGRAITQDEDMIPRMASRHLLPSKVTQPACVEEYRGPMSERWVGGPAYIVSRKLAELIVSYGIWHARGFAAEDVMVSTIACRHGMVPVAGVGYFSDGKEQINR